MTAADEMTQVRDRVHPRVLAGERWVSVVTHLDPRFGGLSAAVPQLARQVAQQSGCSMDLAAFCSPGELFSTTCFPELTVTEWPAGRRQWLLDPSLRRGFARLLGSAEGLHIHGLWEQSTLVAARAARRCGIPYVLSAHGMLESWAVRQKAVKKRVYTALFERANLDGAACLHALTAAEAEDYRRFGCKSPIAIIPNGVKLPEQAGPDLFLRHNPALVGKRIVLFLGRLHAKKGLDLLVEVWREVQARSPEARLVLAGPDFEGTRRRLAALIEDRGLSDSIMLPGMLRDEMKWSALAAAEGYVLPSFSEGLSISVLEAMGLGLPVVISRPCNLPEVEHLQAGAVISPAAEPLRQALDELLSRSPEANRAIGARGREYVRDRFDWTAVSTEMIAVYRWVRHGGQPPSTVSLSSSRAVPSEVRQ